MPFEESYCKFAERLTGLPQPAANKVLALISGLALYTIVITIMLALMIDKMRIKINEVITIANTVKDCCPLFFR